MVNTESKRKRLRDGKTLKLLTASNSSCRSMWCWMNITLWIAFSNSKGYFFLVPTSLKLPSSPTTEGRPLKPAIRPPNLLVAPLAEEWSPLQPPGLCKWWCLRESGDDATEDDEAATVAAAPSFDFFDARSLFLLAAKSDNSCSGTFISSNLGRRLMNTFRTHGAILWVLGFL